MRVSGRTDRCTDTLKLLMKVLDSHIGETYNRIRHKSFSTIRAVKVIMPTNKKTIFHH